MKTILGIDVGASGIKGALVDVQKGKLQGERFRVPTPDPSTPAAMADAFAEIVDFFSYKGVVGCGFPAIVKNGVAHSAANIDKSWIGTNIESVFGQASRTQVLATNDAPPNPLNYRQWFKIYPNPITGDMLYVESKRNVGKPLNYRVFDATGNLVKTGSTTNNNFGIATKGMAKGVYILKIYNGADVNVVTEKVVKN